MENNDDHEDQKTRPPLDAAFRLGYLGEEERTSWQGRLTAVDGVRSGIR
jgi:hypothetical protein